MGMINGARIVATMIDGSLGAAALETALGTAATLASFREAISNRRSARALTESTNAMTALVGSAKASGAAGLSATMLDALAANNAAATTFCNTRAAVSAAGVGMGALYKNVKWTNKAAFNYAGNLVSNGSVLVGFSGVSIASSTDGITFTARTNPNSTQATNYGSVAYGAGLFVAITAAGVGSTIACSSPDGVTWTARTGAAANIKTQVAFGNGVFVVAGNATTSWEYSTNGTTWAAWTAGPFAAANTETRFAEGNDELFICSGTNGYFIKAGTSGATPYTRLTAALGMTPTVCGYINGVYFVANATTAFKYSIDGGNTWISGTLPIAANSQPSYRAQVANGRVYMPANTNGNLLSSADGINWIVESISENTTTYGAVPLGGLVMLPSLGARLHHNAP